jgi:hypothetical protein
VPKLLPLGQSFEQPLLRIENGLLKVVNTVDELLLARIDPYA